MADDGTDLPGGLHPVHIRHLPVDEDEVIGIHPGLAKLHQLQSLRTARNRFGGNAGFFQHQFCMLTGHGVIVNDENAHFMGLYLLIVSGVHSVGIHEGDGDGKGGADALFTLHINVPVHQLHNVFGDGHAQAGAAETVGDGGIFLGEGVKQMGKKVFAHADAGVGDGEAESGLAAELPGPFHGEGDLAALGGEFDRIAEDVDEHLAELHIVADVIIVHLAVDMALVIQPLLLALAAEHSVDGLQQAGEGELLIFQHKPAGLDAGHIQNIIDEVQKMLGRGVNLLQIGFGLFRRFGIVEGNVVQPDDGIHGGADFMAHVGEEGRLGPVGLLRCRQGITESLIFGERLSCLLIHIGKAGAHIVNAVIVRVLRIRDSRKADHLIGFLPVAGNLIAVGDDGLFLQTLTDSVGLNELQEVFQIGLGHITVGVGRDRGEIGEVIPHPEAVLQIGMGLIADTPVLVQLQIIDTPVVGRQGRHHLLQLFASLLFLKELILQGKPVLQFLLLDTAFSLRGLLFQKELCILPCLGEDEQEHGNQSCDHQQRLNHAPPDHPVGNGADIVADHALPDEIGEHPVRPLDGGVAESLPDAVIIKGSDTPPAFGKVSGQVFVGIALFKPGTLHGLQQIVLHRETAENGIAQGDAVSGVDVAEGGVG